MSINDSMMRFLLSLKRPPAALYSDLEQKSNSVQCIQRCAQFFFSF